MPLPVWIVVANGSRARVLQRAQAGEGLAVVKEWDHPASRQHHPDSIDHHRQSGIQGRSGLAERSPARQRERLEFARELGQWLVDALHARAVGRVAILASNPFLGQLMTHGQGTLRKHLCASHAVDLTQLPLYELQERLQQDFQL